MNYRSNLSLKKIEMNGEFLVVSNYFKRIQIRLSDIQDVRKTDWFLTGMPRRVIIRLNKDSGFGKNITFIPYSADEVIDELKRAKRVDIPQR